MDPIAGNQCINSRGKKGKKKKKKKKEGRRPGNRYLYLYYLCMNCCYAAVKTVEQTTNDNNYVTHSVKK